jgi:hypothetical protein
MKEANKLIHRFARDQKKIFTLFFVFRWALLENSFFIIIRRKKENNAKPSDLMLFGKIRRAIKCPEILRSYPVDVSRRLPSFYEILLRLFSIFLFSIWQLFFCSPKKFSFLSKNFHINLLHDSRSVSHVTCSMLHIRALKAAQFTQFDKLFLFIRNL